MNSQLIRNEVQQPKYLKNAAAQLNTKFALNSSLPNATYSYHTVVEKDSLFMCTKSLQQKLLYIYMKLN